MIGRWLWYICLLAIGTATVALQLDRQSALAPQLAGTVPAPARGFAQSQIAASALQSGDPRRAVEEAEILVRSRPIPAESLRLLAQAQFAAGQSEQGFLTIQIAAKRGWRDPVAQEAMLRLAIAAGEEAEAAKRYTALFLQSGTKDALLIEIGSTLFESVEDPAAQTLIEILSGSDRWPDTFLRRGARVLPETAFVAITREAETNGAEFSCRTLNDVIPVLASRNQDAAAQWVSFTDKAC